MELSRHNILTKIHERDEYLLVNLLSREADVLSAAEGARLVGGEHRDDAELVRKGYVVDPQEEARRYRAAYLDFVDARDKDEIQLFYVPSYACNFGCSYCYQDEYAAPPAGGPAAAPDAVLAAFFAYVDDVFAERRKYVTVFGGEPLLPSAAARRAVEGLVEGTARRGLDLAVVTNGYHLAEYLPLLGRARIREVQITLDGTAKVHDARRYLKGGGSTFGPIVAGVDACLAAGLPVNLRSVLDRDNVEGFRELAHFAIDRGWTKSPLFKTQIGRNYELHHCQGEQARLYSRLELYQDLYALVKADPALLAFHRPAFSVARFLFAEGELPDPLFDACPACRTEWAFDASGRIYPCTANVGKPGESVGTFYPERTLDETAVAAWQERDVAGIATCRDCALALACGGGCGAVAKNRVGTIDAPDCRPVRELLALGAGLYGAPDAPG